MTHAVVVHWQGHHQRLRDISVRCVRDYAPPEIARAYNVGRATNTLLDDC